MNFAIFHLLANTIEYGEEEYKENNYYLFLLRLKSNELNDLIFYSTEKNLNKKKLPMEESPIKKICLSLTLTGAGEASTWQFNCTSDPRGAPNNWLGARTEGAKCTLNDTRFETAGGTSFDAWNNTIKNGECYMMLN